MLDRLLSPTFAVPAVAVLLLAVLVVLSALDARAGARASVEDVALAYYAHAEAPDLDQQRAHGQFGVRACALVSQAAFDASMTRGWYVAAARLLRQCGRVMAARSAESKARRARKGVFD